jgi:hypothetical protein
LGNNKQVILDVRNVVVGMKYQIWVESSFWAIYVFMGAQMKVICVLKIKLSYS